MHICFHNLAMFFIWYMYKGTGMNSTKENHMWLSATNSLVVYVFEHPNLDHVSPPPLLEMLGGFNKEEPFLRVTF